MSRTVTEPLDDKKMWREILRDNHPDSHGNHKRFIFLMAVKDRIFLSLEGSEATHIRQPEPPRQPQRESSSHDDSRIPFAAQPSFDELTSLALERAGTVAGVYGELLIMLRDCYFMADMERQQCRGASYRQLAYIAHLAKMDKRQRVGWYRVAEDVPLSDRHCSHLISRLKRSEAA